MFSLTENEKFQQLQSEILSLSSIQDKESIRFGNNEFSIVSNSNTQQSASLSLESHNYDFSFYRNDQDAKLKVIGHQSRFFSVLEWEVIKVEFSP